MADSDEPVNLFAQQEANRRRSRWLIIGFIAFFAWLGFGGDWIMYLATASGPPRERHIFPWFGFLLLGFAGAITAWTRKTGADKVLWSAGAVEVLTPETPEEQQFVNVVEEMSIAAGVPKPRCWIVPDDDPNALATGNDQTHAHIAVTRGLLQLCTRDELQGVVAHEMGHIKNLDVQLMTLVAGLVGAIALISDGVARLLRSGVRFGGSSRGRGGGGGGGKKSAGNPAILVLIAIWFLSWLLAPVISRLLALGISRKREYLADAMSAQFTRNPLALASALEKIEHAQAPTSAIKHGSAHLCIADPLGRRVSAREGWLADRLATHPPMPIRVARLRAMGYQEQKRAAARTMAIVAVLLSSIYASAHAQTTGLPRPHLDWRTVETGHFIMHYPRETEAWATDVAARLEGVHTSVSALVGSAPAARITVLVEDPFNISNGSAWPMLEAPAIYLWPVAPEPQSVIGNSRGWGEILAVHEYAHIAQLTWPSRNRRDRLLWRFMPVRIGPTARRSPRWVIEGYATYVEGKLTGSGRPHGVARAAALRQFALEGRLPSYGQLNAWNTYLGGSMAYLAGSAYLEWLVARRGEESLVRLWRRLSARRNRGFNEAFAGVYGGMPDELYGRFLAELTMKAMTAEHRLREAGLAPGDTVQRLTWGTGEPALSPDGTRMAVVLRFRDRPSRLVVWPTDTQPETEAARRARERMMKLDPLDVPAVPSGPRPRRALATLEPVLGRPHDSPRFMPDGERLLVTRFEPLGDGAARSDVFLWDPRRGAPRRVTRAAGVRNPDPHPDGRSAAAVRCLHGQCDLVRVDLASGRLTVLATGTPSRTFHRPRHSPDGRTIAVGVQDGGLWRIALVDADGGEPSILGAGEASRYAPSFLTPDTLVAVSERGGIQNLEAIAISTGAVRPLTRVTGAALAPEPSHGARAVYFLSLHGKGLDLARLHLDSVDATLAGAVTLDSALAPAAAIPRRVAVDTFPRISLTPARAYGIGPRRYHLLPGGAGGSEGVLATLALGSTDMVGRFTWLAQGSWGTAGAWRGATLGGVWRGTRPSISAAAFHARHAPSRQWSEPLPTTALDIRYTGGLAATEFTFDYGALGARLRAGGSAGRLERAGGEAGSRTMGFAGATTWARQRRNRWWGHQSLMLHGAAGQTGDDWRRGTADLTVGAGRGAQGVEVRGAVGRLSAGAPAFEQFVVGGMRAPMVDRALLSQRVDLAGLPFGVAGGGGEKFWAYRVTLTPGVVQPFFADYRAGARTDERHRVIGVERTFSASGAPLLGFPGIELAGGALYSLDEPFRKELRAYGVVVWEP